jgi:hypothetical protein
MTGYQFSQHANEMLKERNIQEAWVKLALEDPERQEMMEDGTVHYVRAIEEYGGRYLRVVVNPAAKPKRILTVFFDRRIRRS